MSHLYILNTSYFLPGVLIQAIVLKSCVNILQSYISDFIQDEEDTELAELVEMSIQEVSELRQANQWPINLDQPIAGGEGRTYGELIADNSIRDTSEKLDHDMILDAIKFIPRRPELSLSGMQYTTASLNHFKYSRNG